MKRNVYKILIILILILFGCLIFHKDTGLDDTVIENSQPLKTDNNIIEPYKNVTIGEVDYLQSQLPVGKFGGTLTTSLISDPKTFNPYNCSDVTSCELSEIMYDGLTQTDGTTGEVIMKLAKKIDVKEDNKTYIVHLRRGIKWSDRVEITSKDVYFTYNDIIFKGLGIGSTRDVMTIDGQLPEVEIIDKYTLKFTTPKPFAPFLRTLSASIVPEHVFKNAAKSQQTFLTFQGIDADLNKFVISGPFKITQYLASQRVILEKNPNYYLINKDNQKLPYIDKWVNVIVGDVNNATIKFESGVTDILSVNPALIDRYKSLRKSGDFELYNLGNDTATTFIAFNLNNRKNKEGKYYVNPIKQRWFQDRNFRSAIDWAIDRDDLVLNIFHGLASPLFSAEPVKSLFVNKNIAKGHKKDLNYARQLLKESGFYLKDNILYDKFNNKVEFELLTNAGNTPREATGVSIKEDLERLGMVVNFKALEFNSLINKLSSSVDFDCVIMGLTSNVLEPNAGKNVYAPYSALHLFNKRTHNDLEGTDKILDFEKELDDLFTKGALELDFSKRKEIYKKYQEVIAKENPFVFLYAPLSISAVRNKVKNVYPTQFGGLYPSLAEIYIE